MAAKDVKFGADARDKMGKAVTHTQGRLGRNADPGEATDADPHVSGAELLRGACELAVREFGMMAPVVFKQWGLRTTDDVGAIVFNLIRAEKLSKSDRDDRDDFHDLFDLAAALAQGFELSTADYSPRKADRCGPGV